MGILRTGFANNRTERENEAAPKRWRYLIQEKD